MPLQKPVPSCTRTGGALGFFHVRTPGDLATRSWTTLQLLADLEELDDADADAD